MIIVTHWYISKSTHILYSNTSINTAELKYKEKSLIEKPTSEYRAHISLKNKYYK